MGGLGPGHALAALFALVYLYPVAYSAWVSAYEWDLAMKIGDEGGGVSRDFEGRACTRPSRGTPDATQHVEPEEG